MRDNSIKAAARVKHPAWELPPAWPVHVVSDKVVLCKVCGVKSLGFFDAFHTPPKTLGNRPLQAGELAAPGVC